MLFSIVFALTLASFCRSATYDNIGDIPKVNWDFIIVGGGTAGSVVANRLSKNPRFNVLVLEAGPTNKNVTTSIIPGLQASLAISKYDWNYTTVPQLGLNNRTLNYERGHILGGSSSINAMIYTRGSSSDYDRFAEISGDSGWSWNKVQKYIRKTEKFENPADNHNTTGQYDPAVHSTTGILPVTLSGFHDPPVDSIALQAGRELGGDFQFNLDMNSGSPLGLGWFPSTIGHDGTRSSAATAYLNDKVLARKNLHVVTDTRVTRVLQTPGTKGLTIRTVEVRASTTSEPVLLTASKEVILSGGSIGSPLILMHSGIANQDRLRDFGIMPILHNPSVGRNMTDHMLFGISFNLAPNTLDAGPWTNLAADAGLQEKALELWKTNRTGPYVRGPPFNHIAWTRISKNLTDSLGDPSSGSNSAHLELIIAAVTLGLYSISMLLVSPASRGLLSIASNNPFDEPMINPGYLTSDFDLVAAREGVKSAINFARAPAFNNVVTNIAGPFVDGMTDEEMNSVLRNTSASGLHIVGTASMSPKGASWGVVDPDLSVKNVTGLRIVDASVMPFAPCAHIQAATYVIAERGSDMILSDWE